MDGVSTSDVLARAQRELHQLLSAHPDRATTFLRALDEGRIDGAQTYNFDTHCGCAYGHLFYESQDAFSTYSRIAAARRREQAIPLRDARLGWTPLEFVLAKVHPGHTPRNSIVLAMVREWVGDWIAQQAEQGTTAERAVALAEAE